MGGLVHGGLLEIRFFARKNSEVEPIELHFGTLMGGISSHSCDVFCKWEVLVTR